MSLMGVGLVFGSVAVAQADTVYTANSGGGGVSTFAVTPAGPLAPFGQNTVSGHTNGFGGLVLAPDGRHLYLGDLLPGKVVSAGTVTVFSVGAGGLLTQQGPPLTLPEIPFGFAITPNGHDLIVNLGSTLASYAIGQSGALTPNGPTIARPPTDAPAVAITPDGRNVYVANSVDGTISTYSIATNGILAQAGPDVSSAVGPNSEPWALAVTPDGHQLFVANRHDGTVSALVIGAGGALTRTNTSVISGANDHSGVYALAISPNGRYLYSANSGQGSVSSFGIGAGGALTPIQASVLTGRNVHAYPAAVGVSHDSRYLYVANGFDGTVATLAIGNRGQLTRLGTNVPSTYSPDGLAVAQISSPAVSRTAIFGNQRVTITSVPASPCVAATQRLPVDLSATATRRGARFRFVQATLSFTTRRGRRPNAVVRSLPDAAQLSLAHLPAGTHTLTVRLTYVKAHRPSATITRTVSIRVRVC